MRGSTGGDVCEAEAEEGVMCGVKEEVQGMRREP